LACLTVAAVVLICRPPDGLPAQAPTITVSANPVRTSSVTLHWPASGGTAEVRVFSQTGALVAREVLASDPGRWVWNLQTSAGESVANGPYYIVVSLSDGTRLSRRLLLAR
jgi:hypothetical protein